MKITLFIPNLIGCGAERVIVNLANYLCKKGNDVTMLNYIRCDSPYKIEKDIKRVYLYNEEKKLNFFDKLILYFLPKVYYAMQNKKRRKKLKKFIRGNDADCYLVMLERTTIDILTLRKYVKCPIIVSERNYPENYRDKIKKKLYDLSRFADGFVFQTMAARDCYGENVKNYEIIANAVNYDFVDVKAFTGERRKVVVTAGRLEEQKNQALLIKAFADPAFSGYNLEIYGDGPLKESLQNLINDLKISDRAFLKGYSNDIKSSIIDASLFVLASGFEGIPNVLIESMAMGLPCITTDFAGGGAHVLIDDGKNGLIVPANDKETLVAAMKKILSDAAFADKLSAAAREKTKCFAPDRIYGQWCNFIERVCAEKKIIGDDRESL